jgi:hypothetical protein
VSKTLHIIKFVGLKGIILYVLLNVLFKKMKHRMKMGSEYDSTFGFVLEMFFDGTTLLFILEVSSYS